MLNNVEFVGKNPRQKDFVPTNDAQSPMPLRMPLRKCTRLETSPLA